MKGQALEAQQHQDLPFEQVVEMVQPARSLAHTPVFQVMFAWQNTPRGTSGAAGAGGGAGERAPSGTAKFDLTLVVAEAGGGIVGGLEYAHGAVRASDDRAACRAICGGCWRDGRADEAQAVERLPLLERGGAAAACWYGVERDGARSIRGEQCVHELFEAQVERDAGGDRGGVRGDSS